MITLRTPGALLIASQGDCAALTITALIATSTGAAPGPPRAGAAPPGTPLFTVGTTPSPPRGSVVGIDMIAASSGVTALFTGVGFVGLVTTAFALFVGSVGGAVLFEGSVGGAVTEVLSAAALSAAAALVVAGSVAAASVAAEASVAAASVAAAAAASVAAASVAAAAAASVAAASVADASVADASVAAASD